MVPSSLLVQPAAGGRALPEAAGLLKHCTSLLADLDGLAIARQLAPRLSKASDKLSTAMFKALQAVSCWGRVTFQDFEQASRVTAPSSTAPAPSPHIKAGVHEL